MSRWFSALTIGLALNCTPISYASTLHGQTTTRLFTALQGKQGEAVITLERDPGFWGMAPDYKLLIYADGSVVFIGKKNVKTKGTTKGCISPQELQRLVRAFEEIDYFSLRDSYGEGGGCPFFLSDGPRASTRLSLGDKKKSVFHDSGCVERTDKDEMLPYPKALTQLEDLIDAVVNSARWVTSTEPAGD